MNDATTFILYPDLLSGPHPDPAAGHRSWQAARDRTLGYLDTLGIAPVEALELSRQALDRAIDAAAGRENGMPATLAMQMMRQILAEQGRLDIADHRLAPGIRFLPVPAAPEWNRGNMIPQRLEIAPWDSIAGRTMKFTSFRWIAPYLGLLILLLYVYLML